VGLVIARRDGAVLRAAEERDLDAIDELTVLGYAAIQESFVAMVGPDCYDVVHRDPGSSWEQRKCAQNRELFAAHPGQVWVLDDDGVFGYVTFWLFPERRYGHLDNSAVHPDRSGRGWATFMYRHVLDRFRTLGFQFAHVETGLDDAHIPARRAYEAVGFDRTMPVVHLWQSL